VCDAKVNFAVGLPVVRTNVIDEAGQLGSAALQNLPRRQIANLPHADNCDTDTNTWTLNWTSKVAASTSSNSRTEHRIRTDNCATRHHHLDIELYQPKMQQAQVAKGIADRINLNSRQH
jgi:hypothetical protein